MYKKYKVGDKIGNVTLVKKLDKRTKNGNVYFLCLCDCGKKFERSTDCFLESLKHNCIISCGCKRNIKNAERFKKNNCATNQELRDLAIKGMKLYDDTSVVQLERKKINKNSTTGVRGVSYSTDKKHKYRVRLMLRGKEIFLGYAEDLETAKQLRKRGEEKYYKPLIEEYKSVNTE